MHVSMASRWPDESGFWVSSSEFVRQRRTGHLLILREEAASGLRLKILLSWAVRSFVAVIWTKNIHLKHGPVPW